MDTLQDLAKKFGNQIEKELPGGTKFILVLATKERGKCATNIYEPQRSSYLKKLANFSETKGNELMFIEITTGTDKR